MKKTALILVVCTVLYAMESFGQGDSAITDRSAIYNAIRGGVGIEKAPYLELGYSRIGIVDKAWPGSFCFYAAAQVNFTQEDDKYIYGGKVGFETAWMIGMWGAEIKYLTDSKHSQVYFTPKVGLSAVGFASILYGLNLPKRDKMENIGRHQISITVNWSRKLIRYFR